MNFAKVAQANRPGDTDPDETAEWLAALESVVRAAGEDRAEFLLSALDRKAKELGVGTDLAPYLPYRNSIPLERQPPFPGNIAMEERITAIIRWNALAMVMRANKAYGDLGGHIASYASAAEIFEIGFNHFFHADSGADDGDLVFFQPHSAPGVYARAFLEGRLSEEQIKRYRQEVSGGGLSSYPHPWLMPDFWQTPTGSMGIGPITAVYQARFLRYLQHRGLANTETRHVWGVFGDGEMDEPESIAGLSLAAREGLDNLTFVINCNLQRLDGPVRGNGQIIPEPVPRRGLERHQSPLGLGMGCSVCARQKACAAPPVRRHGRWQVSDARRARRRLQSPSLLRRRPRGARPCRAYVGWRHRRAQAWRPRSSQALRGLRIGASNQRQADRYPRQDQEGLWNGRGGRIPHDLASGQETRVEALIAFRDRFALPLTDEQTAALEFYKPAENSAELRYLRARREALGGYLPARRRTTESVPVPPLKAYAEFALKADGKEMSTTMAAVRLFSNLVKDKTLGPRIVPIVADEARTFGMANLFRQVGIYSPHGQLYEPEDAGSMLYYREARDGQLLEEGITEAGAISSWVCAATSYSVHNVAMLPVYIFYSMFGFQRVGDLIWAAADQRSRGFLIGATAGRTTLGGEGLQHQDGSSHVIAATIPNCRAYDPAFAYEVAVIFDHGARAMMEEGKDEFYYVTAMNENYAQPSMPEGVEDDIIKGLYRVEARAPEASSTPVRLLGSGAIFPQVLEASRWLEADWGVASEVWSATSFSELARDAREVERRNRLNPVSPQETSHVSRCLPGTSPIIAATDYVRAYPQ